MSLSDRLQIRDAVEADISCIFAFIRGLAEYERLSHEVVTDEDTLRENLFGKRRFAEVVIAEQQGKAVGFALYFHSFSTFLGRPGIYIEDLYVIPAHRGNGIGRELLSHLAGIAVERNCGRLEWSVLDWNEPAIGFYKSIGGAPMDEWTVYRVTGKPLEDLAAGNEKL